MDLPDLIGGECALDIFHFPLRVRPPPDFRQALRACFDLPFFTSQRGLSGIASEPPKKTAAGTQRR